MHRDEEKGGKVLPSPSLFLQERGERNGSERERESQDGMGRKDVEFLRRDGMKMVNVDGDEEERDKSSICQAE